MPAFFGRDNVPQSVFIHYLKPGTVSFLSGYEDPEELPDILRDGSLDTAVLWIDDQGIEFARYLVKNTEVRFTATGHFLVGRAY